MIEFKNLFEYEIPYRLQNFNENFCETLLAVVDMQTVDDKIKHF